jgi:hypothetical protein
MTLAAIIITVTPYVAGIVIAPALIPLIVRRP